MAKQRKNVSGSDALYEGLRAHGLRGTRIGSVLCEGANAKEQKEGKSHRMRDGSLLLVCLTSSCLVCMRRIFRMESAWMSYEMVRMSAQRAW